MHGIKSAARRAIDSPSRRVGYSAGLGDPFASCTGQQA